MSYYQVKSLEQYFKHYNKSIREPRKFWDKIADENFTWYQKWDKVIEFDMQEAEVKWFTNAKVNITKNCIDRHLAKRGEKTAIIFEPNDPKEEALHITYNELYDRVGLCKDRSDTLSNFCRFFCFGSSRKDNRFRL
jgi:acetyl-CoA synthetase